MRACVSLPASSSQSVHNCRGYGSVFNGEGSSKSMMMWVMVVVLNLWFKKLGFFFRRLKCIVSLFFLFFFQRGPPWLWNNLETNTNYFKWQLFTHFRHPTYCNKIFVPLGKSNRTLCVALELRLHAPLRVAQIDVVNKITGGKSFTKQQNYSDSNAPVPSYGEKTNQANWELTSD